MLLTPKGIRSVIKTDSMLLIPKWGSGHLDRAPRASYPRASCPGARLPAASRAQDGYRQFEFVRRGTLASTIPGHILASILFSIIRDRFSRNFTRNYEKALRPCSAFPLTLGEDKGPKLILWGASRLRILDVCGLLGF